MTETEISRFEYENKPDPPYRVREAYATQTVYTVDWEERGEPIPKDFRTLSSIEAKLLCLFLGQRADLPDDVMDAQDRAHEALVDLREAMLDARGIDDEDARTELHLGNLEALGEVEKRVE